MTKETTMTKMRTEAVFGLSLDVAAEYGQSARSNAYTLLIVVEGEIISVEGFSTADALSDAVADCHGCVRLSL